MNLMNPNHESEFPPSNFFRSRRSRFLVCAPPVSADENWNCDRISGLSKAFSNPENYLTFGWIHFVKNFSSSVVVHCVDTGILGSNGRDDEGFSVLHWAIVGNFGKNNLPIITALLRAGADPNARTKQGSTPLHSAASVRNDPTVVKELIEAGADVNARTKDGLTPLHLAAMTTKVPAAVIILLDAGADPKLKTNTGKTAFDFATKNEAIKRTNVYWRLNDGRLLIGVQF